ncbi:hypothetical protein B566_EDAN005478 [Ephemera danica]|nr:hypothetical protein B566_EDAN005478 [Ephemera danica]
MTLNKNVRSCYSRVQCVTSRHYTTEGAPTSTAPATTTQKARSSRDTTMSAVSQIRNITSNQLKILNQYSKYIVKSAYEQGLSAAVNREWVRMVQKFPTLLGTEQSSAEKTNEKSTQDNTVNLQRDQAEVPEPSPNSHPPSENPQISSSSYSIPQVLNSLRLNFSTTSSQKSEVELAVPNWKIKKMMILSKDANTCRTRHLLSAVANTDVPQSQLKRLEDFIAHLNQNPQAKSLAVKVGAIPTLMRMRSRVNDYDTLHVLQEALAMLGHVEPLPRRGIRILAMDGGGTRGVLVIELLRKLEELTGQRVCDMFDFICGVSTGAIMAMLFGPHKKNLDDCSALYKEISARIFNQSAFWGTGSLLWSHSYYDTALWEKILQTHIGDVQLIKTARDRHCPKVAAVSAVVNQARVRPFVFRNYELPTGVPALYAGSSKAELWQAVRASAAAPAYFEEYRLGDLLLQDGGILVNNPTAIAIHEAKLLWPGERLQCVVSFGTGRNHPVELAVQNDSTTNGDSYSSWKTKFSKILDSATDTEAVHSMLHDLLPDNVYFRFNPYVNEVAAMSEARPEKLQQLEKDAIMYARRNEEKFLQVAAALTQPRSYVQHAQDWIKEKSQILTVT